MIAKERQEKQSRPLTMVELLKRQLDRRYLVPDLTHRPLKQAGDKGEES